MPDLGPTNLLDPNPLALTLCSTNPKPFPNPPNPTQSLPNCSPQTLDSDNPIPAEFNAGSGISGVGGIGDVSSSRDGLMKIKFTRRRKLKGEVQGSKMVLAGGIRDKGLDEYVKEWKERRIANGVPENRCFLPFLVGSPRLAECRACSNYIYPGDGISCSVRDCQVTSHLKCAKDILRCSALKKFKCPQHACFVCKGKFSWRCVRCDLASDHKCAAWPEKVLHLSERQGWAVCWRHPKDWRKSAKPVDTLEDIFSRLPVPYVEEEFKIESTVKESSSNKMEPPSYVHIRRNVYLVKKKREDACMDIGCTCKTSTCSEDCVCRVQCISCSKACHCSETCTNKPFRKEKKIKIVKTEHCGWGVEAAESINKGEFIIEYVGEVVDDRECTKRLWDMKNKNVKNFYMCEIRKDFTIDATFKGNMSRFLNHSCDPNCKLEKWQVEGEIRVGVFAARSINIGEPLTYDYRFVQFGPEVECHCGAANCQGYLGAKRKINLDMIESKRRIQLGELDWGSKRKRSTPTCLAIVSKWKH